MRDVERKEEGRVEMNSGKGGRMKGKQRPDKEVPAKEAGECVD